jgi:hypothetical protein
MKLLNWLNTPFRKRRREKVFRSAGHASRSTINPGWKTVNHNSSLPGLVEVNQYKNPFNK